MASASESIGELTDREMMLLRQIVQEENGLKKWLGGLAAMVAAAAILGSFAVWHTQGQIVVRLDHVEANVAEIRGDVKTLLRGEKP
jgi:hypothetical protein